MSRICSYPGAREMGSVLAKYLKDGVNTPRQAKDSAIQRTLGE